MDAEFIEVGYLSKELDAFRDGAREVHRGTLDRLEEILRLALSELRSVEGAMGAPYQVGLGFWLRSIEACNAAALLTERGMAAMPFAAVRTAFECLFFACAIWRKPALLKKLETYHHSERIKQAKAMVRAGDESRFPPGRFAILREVAEEDAPKDAGISAWEAASAADLVFEYETVYRGCGIAGAHASVRSLDDFYSEQPDGSLALRLQPDIKNFEWLMSMVITCLEGGIQRRREAHTRFAENGHE